MTGIGLAYPGHKQADEGPNNEDPEVLVVVDHATAQADNSEVRLLGGESDLMGWEMTSDK